MSEYCAALSSDLALCHSEPLCQVMLLSGNATVHVEGDPTRATVADWWQALTEGTRQECWPDWLSILNQECPGSKHAQLKLCLGTREERAANAELRQSYRYGRKKGNWACPKGCMTVYLERHGYRPAPTCLPPWMLHQVCGSRYCAAGDQQQGAPEDAYCKVKQALSDESAKHENKTCSAAVAYASSTSMGDFQGSCPHRLAVAQLLKAVPEIFTGHGGCSVQPWLSEPPGKNLQRDQARLCDMWPPPGFAYDAFPSYGNGSVHQLWTPQTLTQAALLRCVSGVQRMHDALPRLWRSPELYSKLLEGSGSWMRALPRAGQVCRKQCESNSSRTAVSGADVAWGAVNGALHTYCTTALASDAAQQASSLGDGSKLGCADALLSLKSNWYQHQLLAVLWLLFVLGLLLGLLVLHLLRHHSKGSIHCCPSPPSCMFRAWNCLSSLVKETPPSYHLTSLPSNQGKSSRCCTVALVLRILRACWFVAEIAMDVGVLITLQMMFGGLPELVESAISQHLLWYIVVLSAPAGVTMLLAVPSVMSAYGVLDFARVRYSVGCCVLLFFSLAWVLLMLIVGVVGGWFIVMADMYMLVALCGVPHHKLLGNKLNMGAYTTLRFMCQGLIQALPWALISTAAIDMLLVTDAHPSDPLGRHVKGVLWASLLLSMSRFAWEVFSLAATTYKLRAPCFVTAIVDVVHHLQPQQASSPSEISDRPHNSHSDQTGLESLPLGEAQAPAGTQVAVTGSKGAPAEQAAPSVPSELAAVPEGAGPASMQAAVQTHGSTSAVAGVSCCSSWGGRACWPQQYPRFTVVYVWVVSLLAGAFVCVVCSHFIWPWLVFDMSESEPLPAESVRPYSLLGLWGNWKLSGSIKGSLKALGSCDLRDITCNLTAPSYTRSSAGVGLRM